MISFAQLLSAGGMFLIPLAICFWRFSNRLTKIETDIGWIKGEIKTFCKNRVV